MTAPSPNRRPHPVTLAQAAADSPTLAKLAQLARESAQQLKDVESLIPLSLQPAIRPGPIDGPAWCLLVDSNAAAAKLRQVVPALLNRLRDRGWQITSIRLKVQIGEK
jgi:hypothetical protein